MDKEKDVCYVVEAHEGIEWVPKARYNFEDTETFLVLAKNPFYRILKDGKDITSKYKQDSGKLQSNSNDSVVYDNSSNSSEISNNSTKPLKPAEYKAMSSECKQKLKADIQRMLDEKTKRNDIFHALNISESTYDIIRTEMKKDESVNKSDVIEPKLNKSARKGTLLGR